MICILQEKLSFKNSFCHRMVVDLLVQCGDITTGDGTGSELFSPITITFVNVKC